MGFGIFNASYPLFEICSIWDVFLPLCSPLFFISSTFMGFYFTHCLFPLNVIVYFLWEGFSFLLVSLFYLFILLLLNFAINFFFVLYFGFLSMVCILEKKKKRKEKNVKRKNQIDGRQY